MCRVKGLIPLNQSPGHAYERELLENQQANAPGIVNNQSLGHAYVTELLENIVKYYDCYQRRLRHLAL